jgi:probable O-glycosylation ligase (exosortase A-associated)
MWLIFTYLLTVVGTILGVCAPFYGLLVYIALSILKPDSLWHWAVPADNYSRIVGIGVLIGWALRGFGNWNLGRAKWSTAAVIAYLLWAVAAALQAYHQDVAWNFVEGTAKLVVPFVAGVTLIDSVRKLKLLAWTIVSCQGYIAFDLNLTYLRGFNQLAEVGFAFMDNNSVAIALVTATGVGLFLILEPSPWWQRGLAFVLTACLAHAVLFSFSRGGMLALVIVGGVSFFLIPRRPRHYAFFAVLVLMGIQLAGPQVRERFLTTFADRSERDQSAESRVQLWLNCLDAIAAEPVFGVGPDHFPLIVERYGWTRGKEAHTLWLQTAAELGVPGAMFLVLFYALTVVRLWPLTREGSSLPDPWLRTTARMVIASLIGFAVAAQFVSLKMLDLPYFVALLGAGALKLASLAPPAAAAKPEETDVTAPEPALIYYPGLSQPRV